MFNIPRCYNDIHRLHGTLFQMPLALKTSKVEHILHQITCKVIQIPELKTISKHLEEITRFKQFHFFHHESV